MALQFSDIDNKHGIIQRIEDELDYADGYISGNSLRLKRWTSRINTVHDQLFARRIQASGTWQLDDTNHSKHPIIKADIVSGQRDYKFTVDEQGNLILDIYRVTVADQDGIFRDLKRQDQQTPDVSNTPFIDGQGATGVPTAYDKTGQAIFFDYIPNYNYTKGIQIHINREAFYFTHTDTTRKSGICAEFSEYYVIASSYEVAVSKGKSQKAEGLLGRKLTMEKAMDTAFSLRQRDVNERFIPLVQNNR